MTLLDQAQALPISRRKRPVVGQEGIELAVAWARGDITFTQVSKVINAKSASTYCFLAYALAEYARRPEGK